MEGIVGVEMRISSYNVAHKHLEAGDRKIPARGLRDRTFFLLCCLLVCVFSLFGIPELFDGALSFGSIQLRNALMIPFFLTVGVVVLAREGMQRVRLYLLAAILVGFLMGSVGVIQRTQIIFEWRIFAYDMFIMLSFVSSIMLVLLYPAWRILNLIRTTYVVWLGWLVADALLLRFHIIPPVWPNDPRVHVWAEFICIDAMMLSLPYLLHPHLQRGPRLLRGRTLAVIGLGVVITVNMAMGARSVLIQVASAFLVSLPLLTKRAHRNWAYAAAACIALLGGALLNSASFGSNVEAIQRLRQTDFANEERIVELKSLFNYMGGYSVLGLGAGSGFPSPTMREGEDFAAYPHISIFAPLQKGGIPAMIVLVLVPLITLTVRLLERRSTLIQQQAATSTFLYLLYASLSGMWMLPLWIILGIGVGYCFYGRSATASDVDCPALGIKSRLPQLLRHI